MQLRWGLDAIANAVGVSINTESDQRPRLKPTYAEMIILATALNNLKPGIGLQLRFFKHVLPIGICLIYSNIFTLRMP